MTFEAFERRCADYAYRGDFNELVREIHLAWPAAGRLVLLLLACSAGTDTRARPPPA